MESLGVNLIQVLAERVRFELTSPVKGCRFSRPVHSTALPPLRRGRRSWASNWANVILSYNGGGIRRGFDIELGEPARHQNR